MGARLTHFGFLWAYCCVSPCVISRQCVTCRPLGIDLEDFTLPGEPCAFSAMVLGIEDAESQPAQFGLLPGDVVVHVGEAPVRGLSFERTMDVLRHQLNICSRFLVRIRHCTSCSQLGADELAQREPLVICFALS